MNMNPASRRSFIGQLACLGAGMAVPPALAAPAPRILKAVKISMVRAGKSLEEKFEISRQAGFDGVSLFAPDMFDLKEALAAQSATGLRIHNINDAVHWKIRLSDPDPVVRKQAIEALKGALEFAGACGADSILLVVGKVTDYRNENHRQVRERSIEGILEALPTAARLGVRILCENVSNGFCTTAEEWADYLDSIDSPWVGAFFDIGNHQRFGGAGHWIRVLGPRTVKIDIKDHNEHLARNCNLFEGHVSWSDVRQALKETRFAGWATSEVQGGDLVRLTEVARRMDRALTGSEA